MSEAEVKSSDEVSGSGSDSEIAEFGLNLGGVGLGSRKRLPDLVPGILVSPL